MSQETAANKLGWPRILLYGCVLLYVVWYAGWLPLPFREHKAQDSVETAAKQVETLRREALPDGEAAGKLLDLQNKLDLASLKVRELESREDQTKLLTGIIVIVLLAALVAGGRQGASSKD